jgi:type II secretory pathway pseudopilin PulG
MGQQQLLLIVLGVIIVGIAVVVGINVFTASSVQANSDALVADCTNLAAMAQQYYRKPTALGGGGNSFVGWTVPASLQQTANMSAAVAPTVTASLVTLVATGTETGPSGNPITVEMRVAPNEIDTTIITTD